MLAPAAVMVLPVRFAGVAPESLQVLYPFAAFAPLVVACLLVAREGPEALGRWWREMFRSPSWGWVIAGLLAFPLLSVAGLLVARWLGGPPPVWREFDWPRDLAVLGGASVVMLVIPGITEEAGWRGFLLPRLQARFGLLLASLLVGLVWAAWHSTDLVMHHEVYDAARFAGKAGWMVAASLVFGGLAHHGRHGLPVAMTTHLGGNLSFAVLPIAPWQGHDPTAFHAATALTFVAGLVLILTARRRAG